MNNFVNYNPALLGYNWALELFATWALFSSWALGSIWLLSTYNWALGLLGIYLGIWALGHLGTWVLELLGIWDLGQ
jgi:hypothetical protein